MALWGFVAGKEAWYTVAEASLKSIVTPVWETVSSVNNLKAVGSAAVNAVIEHPLTAAATAAVGIATFVAYKRKGFGIGLGQIDLNIDTFLAHLKVRTGLGRKKPTEVEDLNTRMRNLEAGILDLRTSEDNRHRETRQAIQGVSNLVTDKFSRLLQAVNGGHDPYHRDTSNLLSAVKEGNSSLIIQMGNVQRDLQQVAGESAGIKAQVAKLTPALK